MKKIGFIYLSAFSTHGGIEKFNRAFLKALIELNFHVSAYSIYDSKASIDKRYFHLGRFSGFRLNRYFTFLKLLTKLLVDSSQVLYIGHLNLTPLLSLLKRIRPRQRMILIAHGIEVWQNVSPSKIKFLEAVDSIWAVSDYTRQRLLSLYELDANKIRVFPNTIDPFFPQLGASNRPIQLIEKYKIPDDSRILLTVGRLSSLESYKGYDRVIEALDSLRDHKIHYLIVGKYDELEKRRVLNLAEKYKAKDNLTLCGFVSDEELIKHYQLADLFVMPSTSEGFGIVFLEALACGTAVIAGNKDGSVNALDHGRLGCLVNPESPSDIANAIKAELAKPKLKAFDVQSARINTVRAIFGFEQFKRRLLGFIEEY